MTDRCCAGRDAGPGPGRANIVRRLLQQWAKAGMQRRAVAELSGLNDRALHDLGLGRGEIGYAARHGRGRDGNPP